MNFSFKDYDKHITYAMNLKRVVGCYWNVEYIAHDSMERKKSVDFSDKDDSRRKLTEVFCDMETYAYLGSIPEIFCEILGGDLDDSMIEEKLKQFKAIHDLYTENVQVLSRSI